MLPVSRNNFMMSLAVTAMPPWSVVDVSHNGLSSKVLEVLAAAGLYVNKNKISGEVSEVVAHNMFDGRITTFYAEHNFLTGFPVPLTPLPDSVALCPSYNYMDLPSIFVADAWATIGEPLESRPTDQPPRSRGDD